MYASYLASLRRHFPEIRKDPISAAYFDRAFILAIEEFERQAVRDPLNERIALQHARVLVLGAYYYDNGRLYESALARLQRAVELAPRRVLTHLALGVAYLNVQRPAEALEAFKRAYAIYPALGRTQAHLALAYAELGNNPEAARWLVSAMQLGHSVDRLFVLRVADALARTGDQQGGLHLLKEYLVTRNGPIFLWALHGGTGGLEDYEVARAASGLFPRRGDSALADALTVAADGLCVRPIPLARLRGMELQPLWSEPADCREPWRTEARY